MYVFLWIIASHNWVHYDHRKYVNASVLMIIMLSSSAGMAVDFSIRRSNALKTDKCPRVASGRTAAGLVALHCLRKLYEL